MALRHHGINGTSLEYQLFSFNVRATDATRNGGFSISLDAMDKLTGSNAVQLGHVDAVVNSACSTSCGLPLE